MGPTVKRLRGWAAFAMLAGMPLAAGRAEASASCAPSAIVERQGSATHAPVPQRPITIASLNVAGRTRIDEVLAAWIEERSIDTLLLQEVGHPSVDGAAFVASLSERLGFYFAYAPANVVGETETQGLAILSRHPIGNVQVQPLTYHHLRFRSRCRIALAATIITASGPVRVVNVHLDTRINSEDRIEQLAPVLDLVDDEDEEPQIIGGDFNTMNIHWLRTMWPIPYASRQTSAVAARLATEGFHTPFQDTPATFKFFGLPLRLDWLYLKGLSSLEWGVDNARYSDHRGVWARVSP